jgi:hypothetical protein
MMSWTGWPYLAIGLIALVVVLLALALYNRREQRRHRARQLGTIFVQWGCELLADFFFAYSEGDYSGMLICVHKLHERLSKEGLPAVLKDLGRKIFLHFVPIPEDLAWYKEAIGAVEKRAVQAAPMIPPAAPPAAPLG